MHLLSLKQLMNKDCVEKDREENKETPVEMPILRIMEFYESPLNYDNTSHHHQTTSQDVVRKRIQCRKTHTET